MASAGQDRNAYLRKVLRPFRAKADVFAVSLFIADCVMYAVCTAAAAAHPWLLVRIVAGTCSGVLLAVLFVLGHDACHGSFTSQRRLNAIIGRIAFLPTLTPFSTWELSHNLTHHVYTNLKPRDYVWTPLTKGEYDALPARRKRLERIYRHPLGLALYYPVEIWWKRLIFPLPRYVQPLKAIYTADSLLCVGIFLLVLVVIARHGFLAVLFAMVWPFAIWIWLMSWALLAQHTHPDVPWFDDEREWRAAQAQTLVTVHVVAPGPLNFILHRIMEHTAHHLDVTVPLYHLASAQAELERQSADVVVQRWTPHSFMEHLRACKLYDYARQQWLDFKGNPTSRAWKSALSE
jgi:omega-6 fatty acid desaturase (delta-12 desaturase)